MPVDTEARLIGLIRTALPFGERVGIALSGGGDSVALLHLCLKAGLSVEAVTVDHALRPESSAEAVAVATSCATLGIRHEVRGWVHGAVAGNLMDQARRARMALIEEWANSRGIGVVALGHTRDDQAETLLMGLARAAGIDGLAGMRRDWREGGVRYVRPLLDAGREELRDWLRGHELRWIDDPTNENERFTRVKARRVLGALRPLGITAEGLADVAGHLAQVKAVLDRVVALAAKRLIEEQAGALVFHPSFHDEPDEVRRRLIVAAVRWLSGAGYAPRADAIARLQAAMQDGRDATLWGCRWQDGRLMREARAVRGLTAQIGEVWDGRWVLDGPDVPGAVVKALGADGLRDCATWRATGIAREVLAVTPALWADDTLLSAPLAGRAETWSARIAAPFHLFGLSH